MSNIVKAILAINPNAKVTVRGENFEQITWHDGTTPISKEDIEAKITELPSVEEELSNKETKKASGKQKLLDLGLTEEEVKALIGV